MVEDHFRIPHQLPPFVPGTDTGLWAQPDRSLTMAAIPVAGHTIIECSDRHYQVDWGDWHLARDGKGINHHRAIDFNTANDPGQTYEILGELDPDQDMRAAFLRRYWMERFRCSSSIFQVRRVTPVEVVGQVANVGVGKRIRTRCGWYTLLPRMWVVRSLVNPNLWWLLSESDMVEEFTNLTTPIGDLVIKLRS